MSNLNIIQKRELEPLLLKANKIVKHYNKAANCTASVMAPDWYTRESNLEPICTRCNDKECIYLHIEAINKARQLGGSYIYMCQKDIVFWTSPFYSGERFAGSLLSGGVENTKKNSKKVKALAHLLLLCADKISGISFVQRKFENKFEDTNPVSMFTHNKERISKDYEYPLDLERMLLASLRRGDNTEGKKILVKLLKIIYLEVMNNFQDIQRIPVFRLKAIELAVLLSRAAANPMDIMNNSFLEATNRYMKKIEESNSFEEIIEILSGITEQMSGMIFSFHGVRHFSALRKAERYIWTHYTRKLSLKEIAGASGLSAPYFSTVFKEEMGENLSNYLNRLRVEKAAAMLITTDLPISEIAITCGFEDQSWFSKIFKNNTGFTPGKYRENGITAEGNILG
ncbi:MAG: helix-turn-helix domain-containing protein [Treponema sp.]|nr:helix-turn-helix domain-containing protein [Treponema sp.]